MIQTSAVLKSNTSMTFKTAKITTTVSNKKWWPAGSPYSTAQSFSKIVSKTPPWLVYETPRQKLRASVEKIRPCACALFSSVPH
jgi:hypothetical protein